MTRDGGKKPDTKLINNKLLELDEKIWKKNQKIIEIIVVRGKLVVS